MEINNINVIFLAAGRGERMKEIASVPKPLLTIGDRAAIAMALEPLLAYGFKKISFILGYDGNLIEYYMRSNYHSLDLSFHYIDEALGTAHSLYQVRHIFPNNPIMVCHADNIFLEKDFNNIDLDRSFLFINGEKKLKAFAYIQEENGLITGAVEKPKKLYSNLVVSGLFYFPNSENVWHATEINFQKKKKSHVEWTLTDTVDTMVNDLGIEVMMHLIDKPIHFGTPKEYLKTINTQKNNSDFITRAMNHITVRKEGKNKIVRKESKSPLGIANLAPEITYLRSIPEYVKRHFPKLHNFTVNYYDMEFINGKNLSDSVHLERIKADSFINAIELVCKILKEDFHTQLVEPNIESIFHEYFIKTQQRLREFQSALKLNSEYITINETKCINPIYLVNDLLKSANSILNLKKMFFTIIHGDLNITNIIYDSQNRSIKLLDPKGKYGGEIFIFGDPSYDIMRIMACVKYGYDTIARGDYYVSVRPEGISVQVGMPEIYIRTHDEVVRILEKNFPNIPRINYELQSILYLLNLLPFHSDSMERSLVFYYWGTYHLNLWMNRQKEENGIIY